VATDVEGLFRRYGPMVLRRCRAMLGDEQAATEAMQEVFVRVLDKDLDVRHPSSLLYQMATHECLTRLRSRRRRRDDAPMPLVERIAEQPDTSERLGAHDLLAKLFGQEPASTRVIAVLALVDGLTWEQTAAEVGMSVSGVRKRIDRLRARLGDLGGT
jgi:RNA polymerase sigma factor (sigma-70 family)